MDKGCEPDCCPKKGDVVELKSGGPTMVVESVDCCGFANCVWFCEEGEAHSDTFSCCCLELVDRCCESKAKPPAKAKPARVKK